jgi:integral membrane protein
VTAPTESSRIAGGRSDAAAVNAALLRFRVIAYVVGVGLITLVFVGVPLRYIGDTPVVSQTVGPLHGLLYMVYLALTLDLATRCRFTAKRTILVMLAGTIPFLSFVAERKISAFVRGSLHDR